MKIKIPVILVHIFACVAFLVLPYFFMPEGRTKFADFIHNPHEQMNILTNLVLIGCFYLCYYVFVPRFFFSGKYFEFIVSVFLLFICITILLLTIDRPDFFRPQPEPPSPPGMPGKPPFGFEISHTLYLFIAILFIALSLQINNRWRKTEQEKLNAEIAYLKAQINPHFLFNTLNSIYSLALEKSDLTADAIAQLSALMRYVITDADNRYVSLEKELAYTQHYIVLQKLRLDHTVQINCVITGDTSGKIIAPLLLIPFIENAFKYGVNPEEDSLIRIQISVADTHLHMNVYNKKVHTQIGEEFSSGIGLENTKTRLVLLYPNNHTLHIIDNLIGFEIDLTIKLV